MEVIIRRIEEELIFVATEDGTVFGVPIDLFENPCIGDIYTIKKIITNKNHISMLDLDDLY